MSAEEASWQDRLIDNFTHPTWRNPYLRVSIFSLLLMHIDTVILLFSNYKLHEYLTVTKLETGERLFRFAYLIDLHAAIKLAIALFIPLVWFFLNLVTSYVVAKYNDRMAAYEKMTLKEFSVKKLRADFHAEKDKVKLLTREKAKLEMDKKSKENELEGFFKLAYGGLIDCHYYLQSLNPDYTKDFAQWLKQTKLKRFDADLSSIIDQPTLDRLNALFKKREINEQEEARHDPEGYQKRREEEEMEDYHQLQDEMSAQSYKEDIESDAENVSRRRWSLFK